MRMPTFMFDLVGLCMMYTMVDLDVDVDFCFLLMFDVHDDRFLS